MSRIAYLPLGSVVVLRSGTTKLLIVGRGLNVKDGEKIYYFDYGAVPYPLGLVSDQMAYFNHDGIRTTLFEGYSDTDNQIMVNNLNDYVAAHEDTIVRREFEE